MSLRAAGLAGIVLAAAAVAAWWAALDAPLPASARDAGGGVEAGAAAAAVAPVASAGAQPVAPVVAPPYGPDAGPPAAVPARISPVQALHATLRAPASTPWERVPVATRVHQLGPAAADVRRALDAVRSELDACFEDEARWLAAHPAAPPTDAADGAPARGPGVLVLQLEARAGALDVVDTTIDSLGTSTPALVDCARHVLRGWPIPARRVAPGSRYRLKLALQ